jgi:hypothetical protein
VGYRRVDGTTCPPFTVLKVLRVSPTWHQSRKPDYAELETPDGLFH